MDEHQPVDRSGNSSEDHGESMAWAAISTLVAGPATWGGFGWLIDHWLESGRVCTAAGVILGFVTSIYIVYKRYGQ